MRVCRSSLKPYYMLWWFGHMSTTYALEEQVVKDEVPEEDMGSDYITVDDSDGSDDDIDKRREHESESQNVSNCKALMI